MVRPARNFPIDLYLLMDLSTSMNDDLKNLKALGANLGSYCDIIVTMWQSIFNLAVLYCNDVIC